MLGSRRIRIHDSGLGRRQGVGKARRRRDHRRVVGAQRERHERRVGQRSPELGVRRDAADDRDALDPGVLRRLAQPLREGEDDRALVGGSEIGPAIGQAAVTEVANGVEQRRS